MLAVGVFTISCTSNQEDAVRDVRAVCIDIGFDGKGPEDSTDNDSPTTPEEITKYADNLDDDVNRAARAARLDQRWDRFSNALTDGQEWFRQSAIESDGTRPESERNAAQEQADQLDGFTDVLRQECRKALA